MSSSGNWVKIGCMFDVQFTSNQHHVKFLMSVWFAYSSFFPLFFLLHQSWCQFDVFSALIAHWLFISQFWLVFSSLNCNFISHYLDFFLLYLAVLTIYVVIRSLWILNKKSPNCEIKKNQSILTKQTSIY